MSYLLAIDISNTLVTFGLFRGEELIAHWRIATDPDKTADEYAVLLANLFTQKELSFSAVEGCVIGCVVPPLLTAFQEVSQRYLDVTSLVVGPGVRTGVRIRTDDPREVGADRIANALAAQRLYGAPAIVIDFSTATAFDAISAEGDYLGDALAPGITISAEALFRHTAKLPRIELAAPRRAIGTNTVASMQSGVIYGYVGMVEGMVARFQRELGGNDKRSRGPELRPSQEIRERDRLSKAKVIATGEQAAIIARQTDVIDVVDPHLTLKGLRLIYEMNRD
jgi:type III pantothenate kinase